MARPKEIFVSSIGENIANDLKFFSVKDFIAIKKVELQQEGCSYLSAHSGSHFSIVMATANGSLYVWSTRPAKYV